jgi:hypothetical protein
MDDAEFALEIWNVFESFLPKVDRLTAAIKFVQLLEDSGYDEELETLAKENKYLDKAYNELYGDEEDSEEE